MTTVAPRKVPIYKLEYDQDFVRRFQEGAADILTSGRDLSNGHWVRQFEAGFARFQGVQHAVAVSSGTSALELALRAIGVEGKEVIVPTNTFIATVISVLRAGGTPVLADVEIQTFGLQPAWLDRLLSPRTAAVVVVHIGGTAAIGSRSIANWCEDHSISLVEDAAQAHGADMAGHFGRIAAWSFFPTKVMSTGEGGMVTTADAELARRVRLLREFGRDFETGAGLAWSYGGSNHKMTEFQGLLGCLELERVGQRINRRRGLSALYWADLQDTSYVPYRVGDGSGYKQVVILPDSFIKERIRAFCAGRDVQLTGEVYANPVHTQPAYKDLGQGQQFPVADIIARSHICPPLYPELTDEDVLYVCQVLKEAVK